jgi:hypothetical protein
MNACCFFLIELAADDFLLVVFQAQPVQQGNQPRTAFVSDAEFPLDEGSDLARATPAILKLAFSRGERPIFVLALFAIDIVV